ncbi:GM19377 [Drosophila sechellia]|uniref:GM19377 n=1 Tax=Drosophila sechellia TaxID=7238 RepID=B4HM63_DROSE|nr:GM19377 [Drosophila sechellia]
MHKVDKRLERIDNESPKKRIENYAVNQLRQCIWMARWTCTACGVRLDSPCHSFITK